MIGGEGLVADTDGLIGGNIYSIYFLDHIYNYATYEYGYVRGYDIDFLRTEVLDPADIYRYSPSQLMKKILAGRDDILGSVYDDLLWGYRGNDVLNGALGADRLDGGVGNDVLIGGQGNDRLIGGVGDDVLQGGFGRDLRYGGADADKFAFDDSGFSVVGAQRDVIQDFETGLDLVDLSKMDANGLWDGNQAFTWIGEAAFTGVG